MSRAGVPFIFLSTDLPDKVLEEERNAFACRLFCPKVRVVAAGLNYSDDLGEVGGVTAMSTEELVALGSTDVMAGLAGAALEARTSPAFDAPLGYLFTGGTHRTKVAQVTHAMFLHERLAYPELWRPRSSAGSPAVLAHTSVYWGATALGQLSIALAYGGTVVLTEATEVADLQRCIAEERVAVIGVVPDHLDLLAPEAPELDLPSVECVFTWGERLPPRVAERWRGHHNAVLQELLIATEYWLALYADPFGDGILRPVRGADVFVLGEDGDCSRSADFGELCIAGPMVTPGYVHVSGSGSAQADAFCEAQGRRYFRTRDFVYRVPGGLVYKGRADMMAKEKGKWVDMLAVEDEIQRLQGVHAAKVIPDPYKEHYHAFVHLAGDCSLGHVLPALRTAIPSHMQLWVVPQLPRHLVTRKVDVAALLRSLPQAPPSWPYEGMNSGPRVPEVLRHRLGNKMLSHYTWMLLALAVFVAAADAENHATQLKLAATWLALMMGAAPREDSMVGTHRGFMITAVWAFSAAALRPTLTKAVRCAGVAVVVTYMWLAVIYADNARHHAPPRSAKARVGEFVMGLVDGIPLLKLGTFAVLTSAGHYLPRPASDACQLFLLALAVFGAGAAWRRGRLLAWPCIFWCIGLGNQMEIECAAWLRASTWWWELSRFAELPRNLGRLLGGRPLNLLKRVLIAGSRGALGTAPPSSAGTMRAHAFVQEEFSCDACRRLVPSVGWPCVDRAGCRFCDACAFIAIAEEEAEAAAWLHAAMGDDQGSLAAPPAKRFRKDADIADSTGKAPELPARAQPMCIVPDPTWTEEDCAKQYRIFDRWWWYTQTEEHFDYDEPAHKFVAHALGERGDEGQGSKDVVVYGENTPADTRLLCQIVAEIVPRLRPVHLGTEFVGLDSLSVARLAYVIKARLGRAVSAADLRQADNVSALAAYLEELEDTRGGSDTMPSDLDQEYAIWFSPGQYSPMGCWVLRSDDAIDMTALQLAMRQLIDRHSALRAEICDPLHYMSVVYDSATLWNLYAPLVEACGLFPARLLKRIMGWSLSQCWPRVRCRTREHIYGQRFPETGVPLEVVRNNFEGKPLRGQDRLEHELKRRVKELQPPFGVSMFELRCHLVDVWAYSNKWHKGRFTILRTARTEDGSELAYADTSSGEWGHLVGPLSPRWQCPPYRFPALYCAPLNTGATAWVRVEKADELRICYQASASARYQHFAAFRAAPQRSREAGGPPAVVNFMSVTMFHSFSDGNSYMPLAQDLFALYDAARTGAAASLPPLVGPSPFEKLQRRLWDTFQCRQTPTRASLRGGVFRYLGRGYGHSFCIPPKTTSLVMRVAERYRVALDVVLLGLVVCGIARADATELVEFTLYTPMRDGAAEATMIGLFSDWRDLAVGADFQLATVLGTLMQLSHIVQHRRWTPFNALRKPERTIVNIQPLDMQRRSHFQHLGENLWHGGDQLMDGAPRRPEAMDPARQPITVNIEQQDEDTWWILVDVGYSERPPAWMRRFSASLRGALDDFIFDPVALVHRPFPETAWF